MLRIALVAVALAVPSLAAAQNAATSFCRNRALPFASFGERSEGCFAIYRQGQAFAARQLSGNRSFCVEGAIMLQ